MSLIERVAQQLARTDKSLDSTRARTSTIEAAQTRLAEFANERNAAQQVDERAQQASEPLDASAPPPAQVREEAAGAMPNVFRRRLISGEQDFRVLQGSIRFDIDLPKLAAAGFITPDAPRSQLASEFRVLKRPLISNVKGKLSSSIARPNLIMVTSAMPGEGKSFTALNLAMSIAMEMDLTVLLVDGDVAQPSLSRILEVPPSRGLIEVLSDSRLRLQDVLLRTNVAKLTILPAGSPHERNTELLASDAMNSLLDEIAHRYPDRIVIFDSPPLLATTESPVLASHMGQIVVVVEAMKTTHVKVAKALATIEHCPVVMMVLNKAMGSSVEDYYGYYQY